MSFWKILYKTSEEEHEVIIESETGDNNFISSILNEIHPDWQEIRISQVNRPEWIKHSLQDWHIPKHRLLKDD
jgi:hypothetical protein